MSNDTAFPNMVVRTQKDRCFFLCVSGQRGTIAKSMHEEHLCVVALTSTDRGTQLSACLLPPCVIAYCSSSTSR